MTDGKSQTRLDSYVIDMETSQIDNPQTVTGKVDDVLGLIGQLSSKVSGNLNLAPKPGAAGVGDDGAKSGASQSAAPAASPAAKAALATENYAKPLAKPEAIKTTKLDVAFDEDLLERARRVGQEEHGQGASTLSAGRRQISRTSSRHNGIFEICRRRPATSSARDAGRSRRGDEPRRFFCSGSRSLSPHSPSSSRVKPLLITAAGRTISSAPLGRREDDVEVRRVPALPTARSLDPDASNGDRARSLHWSRAPAAMPSISVSWRAMASLVGLGDAGEAEPPTIFPLELLTGFLPGDASPGTVIAMLRGGFRHAASLVAERRAVAEGG